MSARRSRAPSDRRAGSTRVLRKLCRAASSDDSRHLEETAVERGVRSIAQRGAAVNRRNHRVGPVRRMTRDDARSRRNACGIDLLHLIGVFEDGVELSGKKLDLLFVELEAGE